jgi:curved DNA-binding protein CbpA
VAEAKLIDYYAVLNLPPTADLVGIENAYARLSNELAYRAEADESSVPALGRVNEAYAVLSKPSLRLEYDQMLFKKVLEQERRELRAENRRRQLLARALVGGLGVLVAFQVLVLAYVGRQDLAGALGSLGATLGLG